MIISATEFKSNMGHYLELVEKEDIVITRNGKRMAKRIDANKDKTDIVHSLRGILSSDSTLEAAKDSRLEKQ